MLLHQAAWLQMFSQAQDGSAKINVSGVVSLIFIYGLRCSMQVWCLAVSSTAKKSSLFAFPLHPLTSVKHGLRYKLL